MADRFGTPQSLLLGDRPVSRSVLSLAAFPPTSTSLCLPILQGCGGAMMVARRPHYHGPYIRKSELIRAMSFVAIPA